MLKKKTKELILKFFDNKGYAIVKKSKVSILKKEFIYLLLFSLQKENKKIIQIGANDGNDLLTEYNKTYHNKIHYIGIEPQETAFIKLRKNYLGFENFNFIKACVGKAGKSSFFYLNENYKKYCEKNNLQFRDTLNSLVKENLEVRLRKKNLNPENYISKYDVEVDSLLNILKKNKLDESYKNIDLLQIDAEGYDDEVIYHSNLDFFKPSYINFEYKNLNKIKLEKLINFLNSQSYDCIKYRKNDCLAVLR